MGSYPVPGEWFDNVAVPSRDEGYDDYDADEFDAFDDEDFDPRPARVLERFELDPLSDAVQKLRTLARRLASEHHPLAHVPQQVANSLVDVRAPAPRPPNGFEVSPTGNCARCGRALPLPTMKRGRPRTLCTTCSPRRG